MIRSIIGQRFGILTVTAMADKPSNGQGKHWLCKCDCGTSSVKRGKDLKNGNTASCGCMQKPPGQKGKGKPNQAISRPWRKLSSAEATDIQSVATRA